MIWNSQLFESDMKWYEILNCLNLIWKKWYEILFSLRIWYVFFFFIGQICWKSDMLTSMHCWLCITFQSRLFDCSDVGMDKMEICWFFWHRIRKWFDCCDVGMDKIEGSQVGSRIDIYVDSSYTGLENGETDKTEHSYYESLVKICVLLEISVGNVSFLLPTFLSIPLKALKIMS